jgi:hypothetical protein
MLQRTNEIIRDPRLPMNARLNPAFPHRSRDDAVHEIRARRH